MFEDRILEEDSESSSDSFQEMRFKVNEKIFYEVVGNYSGGGDYIFSLFIGNRFCEVCADCSYDLVSFGGVLSFDTEARR
jgi:hypothetical protein